jgi:hypothetical protein
MLARYPTLTASQSFRPASEEKKPLLHGSHFEASFGFCLSPTGHFDLSTFIGAVMMNEAPFEPSLVILTAADPVRERSVSFFPSAAEMMHVMLFSFTHSRGLQEEPPTVTFVVAVRNFRDQPNQPKVLGRAGTESIWMAAPDSSTIWSPRGLLASPPRDRIGTSSIASMLLRSAAAHSGTGSTLSHLSAAQL